MHSIIKTTGTILSLGMLVLTGCTPPPPIEQSQAVLWKQFGHQPVDKVLLAWGAPAAETRLTNGSRLITYRHATISDAYSPYETSSGCEVSFLAPPAKFRIDNIAMTGSAYECHLLAQGKTGIRRDVYVPPPPPVPLYIYHYSRF